MNDNKISRCILTLEENGFCEHNTGQFKKRINDELSITFSLDFYNRVYIRTNSKNSKKQEFAIYVMKKDKLIVVNFIQEIIELGNFIHENKQPFSICFYPTLNKSRYSKNKKSIDFIDDNEVYRCSVLNLIEDENGKTCIFKIISRIENKEKIIYSNIK